MQELEPAGIYSFTCFLLEWISILIPGFLLLGWRDSSLGLATLMANYMFPSLGNWGLDQDSQVVQAKFIFVVLWFWQEWWKAVGWKELGGIDRSRWGGCEWKAKKRSMCVQGESRLVKNSQKEQRSWGCYKVLWKALWLEILSPAFM